MLIHLYQKILFKDLIGKIIKNKVTENCIFVFFCDFDLSYIHIIRSLNMLSKTFLIDCKNKWNEFYSAIKPYKNFMGICRGYMYQSITVSLIY